MANMLSPFFFFIKLSNTDELDAKLLRLKEENLDKWNRIAQRSS